MDLEDNGSEEEWIEENEQESDDNDEYLSDIEINNQNEITNDNNNRHPLVSEIKNNRSPENPDNNNKNIISNNIYTLSHEKENRIKEMYINANHSDNFDCRLHNYTDIELNQKKNIKKQKIYNIIQSELYNEKENINFKIKKKLNQMYYFLNKREKLGTLSKHEIIRLQSTYLSFYSKIYPKYKKKNKIKNSKLVDDLGARLYCAGYSLNGDNLFIAGQYEHILIYNTENWKKNNIIYASEISWTITDASFIQNDQKIIYSSITPNVHLIDIDPNEVYSTNSDLKEKILPLYNTRCRRRFGVMCLRPNTAGNEFLAGTTCRSVVLYDIETEKIRSEVCGHIDDVNSVAYINSDNSNVFLTGSDDCSIKIWDKRILGNNGSTTSQGVFLGHTEGITYLSSREDGFYFISNAKDQTCKLWDVRKLYTENQYGKLYKDQLNMNNISFGQKFDYRYQLYPMIGKPINFKDDISIMTYRGHSIFSTLIRCYFSPSNSTAQQFIYTGSADGCIYIYDLLTGDIVHIIDPNYSTMLKSNKLMSKQNKINNYSLGYKKNSVIRDVRWHPYKPSITSCDFYGKIHTIEF